MTLQSTTLTPSAADIMVAPVSRSDRVSKARSIDILYSPSAATHLLLISKFNLLRSEIKSKFRGFSESNPQIASSSRLGLCHESR